MVSPTPTAARASWIPWLALLIPVSYLPAWLSGSHPGFAGTIAIVIATAAAFALAQWGANRAALVGPATPGPKQQTLARFLWPLAITIAALVYAFGVGHAGYERVAAFGRKEAFSVGIFQQALWWSAHGVPLGVTYSTNDGSLHSQLGIHFSPLIMALEPLYKMKSDAAMLLLLQGLALGFAALPLYALSKGLVDRHGAGMIALLWLLHPTVIGAPLTGFHDLAFVPLLLFLALWAMVHRKGFIYFVSIFLLLMLREDMAFVVMGLGLVAMFDRKRWGGWGFASLVLGILWVTIVIGGVMPGYRRPEMLATPDVFLHQYLGRWGATPAAIGQYLVSHPMELPRAITSRESLVYLSTLLKPLALLLPLPDPTWLLGAQPLLLNLAAEGATLRSPIARYSIPVVAAFFAALPGAITLWGRWLGAPAPAGKGPAAMTPEERAAMLRAETRLGSLWREQTEEDWTTPRLESGRQGSPALLVAIPASLLALLLMPISNQFHAPQRIDHADQETILKAIPAEAAVLAPDWSYSRLANRARWSCIGSLEDRALDPKILESFDVVVVDMGVGSFERERYPELLPALLLRLSGNRKFAETLTAGEIHLFSAVHGRPR